MSEKFDNKVPSPEEIADIKTMRAKKIGELVDGGARYFPDESGEEGKEQFVVTSEQVENAREEMEDEKIKIHIRIGRHDDKEKIKGIPDREANLNKTGINHAIEVATEGTNIENAKILSSDRRRTKLTGLLNAFGKKFTPEQIENATLESLLKIVNVGGGNKVRVEDRLDFSVSPETPFGKIAYDYFGKGKFLKFIVEDSDALAEKMGKEAENEDTYSRMASRTADVVLDKFKAFPRYEKVAREKSDGTKSNKMERFLVSHQGVTESFLLKLIEMRKGKEERDTLVSLLNNQGFGFSEGFDIDIMYDGDGKEVAHVTYKKQYKDEKGEEKEFVFDENFDGKEIESLIIKKEKTK